MKVLFVTSEVYPLAKTGGLADVSRALPIALAKVGIDVRLLMPAYPSALAQLGKARVAMEFEDILDISGGRLIASHLPGSDIPIWLVDAPSLFNRAGGPYQDPSGDDWPDNAERFAFLSHVAAEIATGVPQLAWKPDVVHANDWHTGLLPLLLRSSGKEVPPTVFTIHNIAFQGNFPSHVFDKIGVPASSFTPDGLEFYGQVSFLKSGIRYSDRITTVSPTYAQEVMTPQFGCGMEGLLRDRADAFHGIMNGAEYDLWDPIADPHLPVIYGHKNAAVRKKTCKAELQRELGLPALPDVPLIAFSSRLTEQKMADIVLESLPWISSQGAQFAMVAQGERTFEAGFAAAGQKDPHAIAIHVGYEERLAHRLLAGADILLAPSRYEPCGLIQLYAMRYGTLPVVRRTGGLADTVIDTRRQTVADRTATGFQFEHATAGDLTEAVSRALDFFEEPLVWRRVQGQAMAADFGWDSSASKYYSLYAEVSGITEPLDPTLDVDASEEALAQA